ncbi:hypothetical protein [Snodgrassella alvi]|uniref:hypothetical protein n=1 Tax=Snodgrassella alvi TaxID=1196083 RepID=UPI001179914D|nr:hypothetical protein [Snodgrassella alvi]
MHHSTPPPIGGEGAGGAIAGAKSRFAGKTAPFTAPLVVHWWCKSHKLLFYMDFNCTTYCTTAPPGGATRSHLASALSCERHKAGTTHCPLCLTKSTQLSVYRSSATVIHNKPSCNPITFIATKRELPTVLCVFYKA